MNFADQYKNSQAEERLIDLEREEGPLMEIEFDMDGPGFSEEDTITISEHRFMEIAEKASWNMLRDMKEAAEEEGVDIPHMLMAATMSNLILINDLCNALFGDDDVPEEK